MTTALQKSPVNTARAARRKLRFNTVAEAIAEAERIAALEIDGRLQTTGNWTAGQILNHCGAWAEFAFKPNPLKMPLIIRLLVRPFRSRFLNVGLPSGQRVPKVPGGTLVTEAVDTRQALGRFREAYLRLTREQPTHASPLVGVMTQEDAIKLNLRHAELHMSFVSN